MEPAPKEISAWRWTGFLVPTTIAAVWGGWGAISAHLHPTGGGYQGIAYIFGMVIALPIVGAWAILGRAYARANGPSGAPSAFMTGALAGIGGAIIALTVTCFASYA